MKITDLVPDGNNYNKGTDEGAKMLRKSLKKLGAGRSVLIDANGNVVAGNKTLEAAKAAGIDEVVVVKTNGRQLVAVQRTDLDLNSEQGREMALADNATAKANIAWDFAALETDGWGADELEGWGVEWEGEAQENGTETKTFRSLQEVFIVPPFSVLDTRAGYWQERKRAWLAKGIKSEEGRGGDDVQFTCQRGAKSFENQQGLAKIMRQKHGVNTQRKN